MGRNGTAQRTIPTIGMSLRDQGHAKPQTHPKLGVVHLILANAGGPPPVSQKGGCPASSFPSLASVKSFPPFCQLTTINPVLGFPCGSDHPVRVLMADAIRRFCDIVRPSGGRFITVAVFPAAFPATRFAPPASSPATLRRITVTCGKLH
jgi:hypothetical protein